MFKSALIGFLIGVACVGTFWFFYGRPDIKRVRQDLDAVHEIYEQVQRDSDTVAIDASGLTGDIAGINSESGTAVERLESITGKSSVNTEQIRFISGKVDELEQLNTNLIRLGRDFGGLAFDLRRLSEANGEE